jgi:uncharacterized protein YjbJ (UPF0337 family)
MQAPIKRTRALPSANEIKGRWKQRLGAAKLTWDRISESELLTLEGHEQKLSGLIQERYAITRDEAIAQVRAFFNKHLP